MMDVALLAKDLTATLLPFLPYLMKLGDKTAEEAAKKMGGEAWEQVKALWSRIHPAVEAVPSAKESVAELTAQPDDTDAQAVFRVQLKKLLAGDTTLAGEIAAILDADRRPGERSIAVGGDAIGVFITGDKNRVTSKR